MAITDRGSARIVPTDSTGAMVIGALTITGTKHRAIAASDGRRPYINCSCKRPVEAVLAPTSNRRLSYLKRSDGCSGFPNKVRNVACAVSAQSEMSFRFTPLRTADSTALFPCFLAFRIRPVYYSAPYVGKRRKQAKTTAKALYRCRLSRGRLARAWPRAQRR